MYATVGIKKVNKLLQTGVMTLIAGRAHGTDSIAVVTQSEVLA